MTIPSLFRPGPAIRTAIGMSRSPTPIRIIRTRTTVISTEHYDYWL